MDLNFKLYKKIKVTIQTLSLISQVTCHHQNYFIALFSSVFTKN